MLSRSDLTRCSLVCCVLIEFHSHVQDVGTITLVRFPEVVYVDVGSEDRLPTVSKGFSCLVLDSREHCLEGGHHDFALGHVTGELPLAALPSLIFTGCGARSGELNLKIGRVSGDRSFAYEKSPVQILDFLQDVADLLYVHRSSE